MMGEFQKKPGWNSIKVIYGFSLRYGFVTFAEASCAYEVIDKFTKDPLISNFDIRFGGRRKFCKQTYADLGN